ncbi:MAG: hypothetical protein HY232_03505 [Acidobacteria bacterium]|nr:hypothetical protein [Acidobacteriota bacterium]
MKGKSLVLISMLVIFLFCLNVQKSTGTSGGPASPETCKDCHVSQYESFVKSSHGAKGDSRTPAAKNGCETCHGPGDAHVAAGGGKETIIPMGPKSATPVEKQNATCL